MRSKRLAAFVSAGGKQWIGTNGSLAFSSTDFFASLTDNVLSTIRGPANNRMGFAAKIVAVGVNVTTNNNTAETAMQLEINGIKATDYEFSVGATTTGLFEATGSADIAKDDLVLWHMETTDALNLFALGDRYIIIEF